MAGKKYSLIILGLVLFLNMSLINAGSIKSVKWDKLYTKAYEDRYIIASTSDYNDNTPINFEIWEDDVECFLGLPPGCGDDYVSSVSGVIKNSRAIALWGGSDGADCLYCNNAEYYIKAKVGGNSLNSGIIDFRASGSMGHNDWDCNADSYCKNKLYCEGIPWYTGGGGFSGDGCCYDYENWNIDQHSCNYAIKGQVSKVTTTPSGNFNSRSFSNLNMFFVVYDYTSLLGRLMGNPMFIDYIRADSNGNFEYNPEFNHQTAWNSNILFDWNVEVYALDENNKPIAKWTNSFTNDNDKYKRGNDYIDQRVRIHIDKPYWKDFSENDLPINKMSIQGFNEQESASKPIVPLSSEQENQIKIIKSKIKLEENFNQIKNSNNQIIAKSLNEGETPIDENDSEKSYQEEVIYNLWNGILLIDDEKEYSFNSTIIGGYKLTMDNKTITDTLFSDENPDKSILLSKGEHNLTIEYVHLIERTSPNLLWRIDENQYSIIPSSNLIKKSFNFQYYTLDLEQNVTPIEKYNKQEEFSQLTKSSSNNIKSYSTSSSSSTGSSSKYYQVSFLEAPRKQLNINIEPLILIHGLNGESGYFDGHFENNLLSKGYDVWKFYYPSDQKIDYSGALLSDGISYVKTFYNTPKVKIVTHSMGGPVTMSYLEGISQDSNGINIPYRDDISKLIMLAPPNYGSYLANRVLYDEDMGAICNTLNQVGGWLLFGKPFIQWDKEAPAYSDLAIGSHFNWELNNRTYNNNVDTLIIAGKDQEIPCIPFEADQSDSLVSVASASKLGSRVPLILMNKNHLTIYKQLGQEINFWWLIWNYFTGNYWSIAKSLISGFFNSITNINDVSELINQFFTGQKNYKSYLDSGELYINPNDPNSDTNPYNEGTSLIKISNIDTLQINEMKIVNDTSQFLFTQNPQSKIFYHFNYNPNSVDYGLTIPQGNYKLYVNGINTGKSIEIKPTQTALYHICLPNLTNTTWSSWINISCLINDKMNQTRSKVQYDSNNCGDITNKTFYQYRQTEYCNNCSQNIQGPYYTEWSKCSESLKRNRTRYYLDLNYTFCCFITDLPLDCEIKYNSLFYNSTEIDNCTQPNETPIIHDPQEGEIFNYRKILVNVSVKVPVKYIKYQVDGKKFRNGQPIFNDLCTNCQNTSKYITFLEGNHTLGIVTINEDNRQFSDDVNFIIDLKQPQISSTKPKARSFNNGSGFIVKYTEENLNETTLLFVNEKITKTDCPLGKNQECLFNVNLSLYNNQEILYWFKLIDIAGNTYESRKTKVIVDTSPPIINNSSDYWKRVDKYIYFNISIEEKNLDYVKYMDNNDNKPSWKVLCSRLKNGICSKKLLFKGISPNIKIRILDKAGNSAEKTVDFAV